MSTFFYSSIILESILQDQFKTLHKIKSDYSFQELLDETI